MPYKYNKLTNILETNMKYYVTIPIYLLATIPFRSATLCTDRGFSPYQQLMLLLILEQAMKVQTGSTGIVLLFL